MASRVAEIDINYRAILTQAQQAHDEFVRQCEARPINLRFVAESPDRPTPSTFGGGAVGGSNAIASSFQIANASQFDPRPASTLSNSFASSSANFGSRLDARYPLSERVLPSPFSSDTSDHQRSYSSSETVFGRRSGGRTTDAPPEVTSGAPGSAAYEAAARRLELAEAANNPTRVGLLKGYSDESGDTAKGVNYSARATELQSRINKALERQAELEERKTAAVGDSLNTARQRLDLVRAPDRESRIALLKQYAAEAGGESTPEGLRRLTQVAQEENSSEDGGGGQGGFSGNNFFKRITSRLTRGAGAYFAYREVQAAAQAFEQNQAGERTLRTEGIDPYLQQQKSIAEGRTTDGLGHMFRQDISTVYQLFGGSKNNAFDDDATLDSVNGAIVARTRDKSILNAGMQRRATERTVDDYEGQTRTVETRNPYRRQLTEHAETYFKTEREQSDKLFDLNEQLKDARQSNDQKEVARLSPLVQQTKRDFGPTMAGAARFRNAQDDNTKIDEAIAGLGMRWQNASDAASREGFSERSAMFALNARFKPLRDQRTGAITSFDGGDTKPGDTLYDPTKKAYEQGQQRVEDDEQRRTIIAGSSIRSNLALLNRRPLEAEIAENDAAFQARNVGRSNFSPESIQDRIATILQDANAKRIDADHRRISGIGLDTEQASLQTRINAGRNPLGGLESNIVDTVGSGLGRAASFAQAGYGDLAHQALGNTSLQLDAQEQQFQNGFGTKEANPFLTAFSSPGVGEDPSGVFNAFEKARGVLSGPLGAGDDAKSIIDKIDDLKQSLVAALENL